jgi:hypothetical protein
MFYILAKFYKILNFTESMLEYEIFSIKKVTLVRRIILNLFMIRLHSKHLEGNTGNANMKK